MSTLSVLVRNREISSYHYRGKTWIEGRPGSNYTLKFFNSNMNRVKVVLSVDGLNIISGNNDWSKGYIVNGFETVEIPGWSKDNNNVAKFQFGRLGETYNEHNLSGDSNNIGVIGAQVFEEHVQPYFGYFGVASLPLTYVAPAPYWTYGPITYNDNTNIRNDGHTVNLQNSSYTLTGGTVGGIPGSVACCNYTASVGGVNAPGPITDDLHGSIGTKYGANQVFHTNEVSFNAKPVASETLLIYYDDYKGLQRRGVITPKRKYSEPQAFPNRFCPPPINK